MATPRTVFDIGNIISFFRRLDRKIESVSNDFREQDSRMICAVQELKSYQERLAKNLEVLVNTQEDLIVSKAINEWFTKKEEELEAQLDQLSPEIEELDSTNEDLPVSFGPSEGEIIEDQYLNLLVRGLRDPLRRLTGHLNLSVPSDAERKSIDDILARSHELLVEISLLAVELFIQLCHKNNKKEMSLFQTFMGHMRTEAEEDSDREATKWIVHVLNVAREELKQEDTTEGQEETPTVTLVEAGQDSTTSATVTLVEDLINQLTLVIAQLDSLMNLDLIEKPLPIAQVVELIDVKFKDIKRAVESIKRDAEVLSIRLKFGRFSPVIIGLANTCGLCFKLWSCLG